MKIIDDEAFTNEKIINCFIDFLNLYDKEAPSSDTVKKFITKKSKEKQLVESFKSNLITQDELCSLLLGYLYTEYLLDKNLRKQDETDIRNKLFRLLED